MFSCGLRWTLSYSHVGSKALINRLDMTNTEPEIFSETLPPTAVMLLLCARTRMPEDVVAQAQILAQTLDWARFEHLALDHGMTALIYPNLRQYFMDQVPDEILSRFRRDAIDNTQSNLGLIRELHGAIQQLSSQGIGYAAFKGLTISQAVYRDFSKRKCGDIDILIQKKDFRRAKALFIGQGFEPVLTDEIERLCLQSDLWHEKRRVQVDLHWGIPPAQLGIRAERLMTNRSTLEIGGMPVSVLSREDMLIMTAVNAVKEYWNQSLYPYCDLHEFLRGDMAPDWELLFTRADALNCMRPLEVALRMVKELYRYDDFPALVQERISGESPTELVARELLQQIFEKKGHAGGIIPFIEHGRLYYFDTAKDYYLSLMDTNFLRFKYSLQKYARPNEADKRLIRLPGRLYFLYYVLRPVRLAGKQGVRLAHRLMGRQ